MTGLFITRGDFEVRMIEHNGNLKLPFRRERGSCLDRIIGGVGVARVKQAKVIDLFHRVVLIGKLLISFIVPKTRSSPLEIVFLRRLSGHCRFPLSRHFTSRRALSHSPYSNSWPQVIGLEFLVKHTEEEQSFGSSFRWDMLTRISFVRSAYFSGCPLKNTHFLYF